MPVFVDPAELRAVAHRVAHHADHLRVRAAALALAAEQTRWHSPAAAGFRAQVHGITRDLRRGASELDAAATAMLRHADRVGSVLEVVRGGWDSLVLGAASALGDLSVLGESALGEVGGLGESVLGGVGHALVGWAGW